MKKERELVPVPVKRRSEEQTNESHKYLEETAPVRPKEMPKRWYIY